MREMVNPYQLFRFVPLNVLRRLAQGVAWLINKLPNLKIHRTISTNLLLAYPNLDHQHQQQLHKKIIENQCLSSVESLKAWASTPIWCIKQIHTVHNEEAFKNALACPQGMLVVVPHLGSWEMMNAWLNQFGTPTIMYKPIPQQQLNAFMLAGRQKLGAKLVPTNTDGVKAIFRTLKQGGFSIVLPDHVPNPKGGVVVPFFNIPTLTSTLVPKLAQKTGCALVGLACIRRPDHQGFDIYCHTLDDPKLYDNNLSVATEALNTAIKNLVTPFKEHYFWHYRRFKYLPNIDNVYALDTPTIKQLLPTLTTDEH